MRLINCICLAMACLLTSWGASAAPPHGEVPMLLGISPETSSQNGIDTSSVQQLRQQLHVQKVRIMELTRTIEALNRQRVQADSRPSSEKIVQLTKAQNFANKTINALRGELEEWRMKVQAAKDVDVGRSKQIEMLTVRLKVLHDAVQKQTTLVETLTTERTTLKQDVAQARMDLSDSQRQSNDLQQKLKDEMAVQAAALKLKDDNLQAQQQALKESRAALAAATVRVKPEGQIAVRDYAIGASLAQDMLTLLQERETDGVKVDRTQALVGVQDTFNGSLQLPEKTLKDALITSEKEVTQSLATRQAHAEKVGAAYMADFSKRKGVKRHPDGFLYLVDYAGDGAIGDIDTVAIAVKESLTDGTVINDMDVSGTRVSQPLNAYPALFQSAIRLLKNHGSVTLVVPPKLAYGDKGYPPMIPPGATMIYTLRIQDVLTPQEVKP